MINENNTFLSICIPAFGRIELVRNTLNSIYSTKNLVECNISDFEVIISDNDPDRKLEMLLSEFEFSNLYYYPTKCEGFMNSFYVLTYAKGLFFKLHNSQVLWNYESLSFVIEMVKANIESKPLVFFTNGLLRNGKNYTFYNFDKFMYDLSYWSSWSNGFCIWKSDFDKIDTSMSLNELFPHTTIFLTQYEKPMFIINDKRLFTVQFVKNKGGHNKFHAFTIEFASMIDASFINGFISFKTKKKILMDILTNVLPIFFFTSKIVKREKFSSENFNEDIKMYFPKGSYIFVIFLSFVVPFKLLLRKFKLKFFLSN